jgi:hypothetical protein
MTATIQNTLPTQPNLAKANAKANIALLFLSLGVPLIVFATFGLIRQAFVAAANNASTELSLPPGLYNRSQPNPLATPAPAQSTEFEWAVPTATPGGPEPYNPPPPPADSPVMTWHCIAMDRRGFDCGENGIISGFDMTTGQPIPLDDQSTSFSTGSADHQNHVNQPATGPGYTTTSGMRGGN